MGGAAQKTSRPFSSFLLGVTGTVLILIAHGLGFDDKAELQTLDWRLQHAAPHEPPADILHVDIDDRSLSELGRWPWPREQLAGVIQTLHDVGAKMVVLDIILPEPQKARFVSVLGEVYDTDTSAVLQEAPPLRVYDDMILTRTVRRVKDVFLPFHVNFGPDDTPPTRKAIQQAVAKELKADPEASFKQVQAELSRTSDIPPGAEDLLAGAYLRRQSLSALRRFALDDDTIKDFPLREGFLVPPIPPLARAADGSGYVTFEPDSDGAVRHIPLLCRAEGRVYPQFALAVAIEALAREHGGECDVQAADDSILLRCLDGTQREIPVNSEGLLLIRWVNRKPAGANPVTGMRHVSAGGVGGIWRDQQNRITNRRRQRVIQIQLAKLLNQDDLLELFARADQAFLQRQAARRDRYNAMLYNPAHVPPEPTELLQAEKNLEKQIDEAWAAFSKEMDEFYLAQRPEDETGAAVYDQCTALRKMLGEIQTSNRAIARQIREDKTRLAKYVRGNICLIGSTSTGAADFVPTPLGPRTPGVVVHSNILHTILAGDFPREAPGWANWGAIIVCGLLISALSAWRTALQAGLFAAAAAVGYFLLNVWVLFAVLDIWLVLVGPIAAMAGSFLLVAAYRQLTEERAKRRIRGMFAHALSETLVARIEEDPSILQLGGQQRTLTCMFSDIAGFTPLSERLGPEGTVRLLNRYFDHITETVQNRRGGYLNKFLGDGIFAFFGAPVFQDDHARRALHAAIDCQNDVLRFNEQLSNEMGGEVRLSVRIGVTTGEAMVGNCGSTQRMDYTAIGDCVNLASRLEAANKFFGTSILVTDETWRQGKEAGLLARPLGRVLATGQREPVAVWNLLCRDEEATDEHRRAVADFLEGLDCFQKQAFAEAAEKFQRTQTQLPNDGPAGVYLEMCNLCQNDPAAKDTPGYQTRSGKGVDTILWPWSNSDIIS
ncbi:MAG: adenylate/guanylate cyclase domain-containing protein [Phycisphaerae bacterium]|nr:adenylate/guanylate cyclase domain-containing protein [Phycisphaerae bacterium]